MQYFVYFTMSEDKPMNPPTPEGMAEMGQFMAESFQSGTIVATGQLPSTSTQVRLQAGKVSTTDGPFIESKEMIPGFTVIRVDNKQQAIDWTARLSKCMGGSEVRMALLSATGVEDL
jgi:hypothetical protein